MRTFTIEINTQYTGIDELTLKDYIHNMFQHGKRPDLAKQLLEQGKVSFSSKQPDGPGYAHTTYKIKDTPDETLGKGE